MIAELIERNNSLEKKVKNTKIFLLLIFSFILFFPSLGNANTTSIIVEGNQRIETQTIVTISGLSTGVTHSDNDINKALLLLNKTKYFQSVNLRYENNKIIISVIENPTINSVSFEGNKLLQDENLLKLISTNERQTYSAVRAEGDAEKIAKAYIAIGRLGAQIVPKIINQSDNRVDLIFEINEGDIIEIEKITFIGNRFFSEKRLRGIIATKQAGIFRRLMKSDTFIDERINYDMQLLRDFYINKGFIDFNVISSSTAMTREKDAILLNFTIEEGQQYSYGKISINSEDKKIDTQKLIKLNKIKNNSNYDPRKLKKLIEDIEIRLSKNGNTFIKVSPRLRIDTENLTVNIEIDLLESQKIFVERIEVEGNSTTLDEVIRFKFDFVEGDPFDMRKVQEATDRIRGLGFFSDVSVTTRSGSTNEKIIINVKVKEKATGSLGIGAGYNSSDGSVFTFNINERNFLGKGQTVDFDLSSSSSEKQISLGLVDPTFLDRNLHAGISFGTKTSTPYSVPLITESRFFSPMMKFPLSNYTTLSVIYRYDNDQIKLSSASTVTSPLISADVGDKLKSGIILSYNLDKANSVVRPTSGYKFEAKQEINGLGGDVKHLKTALELNTYNTLFTDNIILTSNISTGLISGDDANFSDRFSLGGDELPGFRNFGIGPIDNTYSGSTANGDPLGGKMFSVVNLETSFPIGIPEEYGVFGGIFLSAGSVWGLDNVTSGSNTIDDSFKLRSAAGVSIFWDTLIGPLRFNFSRPIKKELNDITENFRFTVDTRF